mmetsp:Transcript_2631/g.3513  ORF Transcript_2631/g.3513 Transcript_2631/m.3513 type:complete len:251 (+) Transcript_2631:43-795(+)
MFTVYNADDGSDLRRGKVSSYLLPQEDMMERFVSPILEKPKSWKTSKKGWFGKVKKVSVCTWLGVVCDSTQTIIGISWYHSFRTLRLRGHLSWDNLPKTLLHIAVVGHPRLEGAVTEIQYPEQLDYFIAETNVLSGALDLTNLPRTLTEMMVQSNRFSGEINLTALPPMLLQLFLDRNLFTGTIKLDKLPETIQYLGLHRNRLEGVVDLKTLLKPTNRDVIVHLDLRRNNFSSYAPDVKLPSYVMYLPQG